jgi:Cof subfamily protein (haloacid dehalogenase superfamily)
MPKPLPNYKTLDVESLRPFSRIRLVALDLDGTLLESSESELPKKVLDLARRLKTPAYGVVRITIATGRTLTGVSPLIDRLPILNNTPIILYNGSVVLNRKYNILNHSVIPNRSLQRVIEVSSRFKVKVIAYVCDWFAEDRPQEYAYGWSYVDRPQLEHNKMPVKWLNWDNIERTIRPSAIVIHTFGQPDVISNIISKLGSMEEISYTRGGKAYIEVKPRNSNKGEALKYVAESLRLSSAEVLAMGDNDNDAEMLSWAGVGVAVNSASDLALRSSNYIANRGVIEGAIEVLRIVRSARHLLRK